MNTDAINLGRSLFFGGGGGASVRYGTVRSVNAGRVTVDVDGGLVEAPAMTCVPADAAGRRCVVLAEGASATVLGVLGEAPEAAPDLTDRVDVLEGLVAALEAGLRPVSTGSSGLWTYVIWSNGQAECWKSFDADEVAFDAAYGNAYFQAYESDLPIAFAETPHAWVTARTETGGLLGASLNGGCSATRLGFYVYSMKHEAALNLRVQIYVRGRVAQ